MLVDEIGFSSARVGLRELNGWLSGDVLLDGAMLRRLSRVLNVPLADLEVAIETDLRLLRPRLQARIDQSRRRLAFLDRSAFRMLVAAGCTLAFAVVVGVPSYIMNAGSLLGPDAGIRLRWEVMAFIGFLSLAILLRLAAAGLRRAEPKSLQVRW